MHKNASRCESPFLTTLNSPSHSPVKTATPRRFADVLSVGERLPIPLLFAVAKMSLQSASHLFAQPFSHPQSHLPNSLSSSSRELIFPHLLNKPPPYRKFSSLIVRRCRSDHKSPYGYFR